MAYLDSILNSPQLNGLINVGNDHIQNMANFSMFINAHSSIGGGDDKKKPPTRTPEELQNFGNWTGQEDTSVMAKDLMDRGLMNGGQVLSYSADQNDPNSIKNTQSDWLPSAVGKITSNALRYNLRSPDAILANKKVLMNSLDPRIQDAINDPIFNRIHGNFWDILAKSIIPQQWNKLDKATTNATVKK